MTLVVIFLLFTIGSSSIGETKDLNQLVTSNPCLQAGITCPPIDGPDSVYGALPDCTKFCQCSNGLPYLHNCIHGLHFNPVLNVCDWPGNAGCTGGLTTDGTTTTEAITTSTSSTITSEAATPTTNITTIENRSTSETNICLQHNITCPPIDGPDSVYGALPDCTKFCQCSNGLPYLHNCIHGLHFNPVLNVCDWPDNAGCTGGSTTAAASSTTVTTEAATTTIENRSTSGTDTCLQHNITCPPIDGPDSVYGALPDCTKFCQCSNGLPYLHNCIHGLHFNPVLNVCDWPDNAGCTGGSTTAAASSTTVTTEAATSTIENRSTSGTDTCLQHNITCPPIDGPDSVYGALPDCTKFCQCSNGLPYLHNCIHGLHFNPVLNVCDWPDNAGCTGGSTTAAATTTSSTTVTTEAATTTIENRSTSGTDTCLQHNITCPPIDGPDSVYGALPDCTKFCQCSNGLPYLHNCIHGLHFNPVLNVCDWPDNAGCTGGSTTAAATTTSSTTVTTEAVTTTSSTTVTTEAAITTLSTTVTTEAATTTIENRGTEICLQHNISCPAVDGSDSIYTALPDCTKFCQCSNGVPYLHSCPSSLHFNPTLNVCDWPNDAGCIGNNNTTPAVSTDAEEITNEGTTQEDYTEAETTELDLTETSVITDDYTEDNTIETTINEDYTEENTSTEENITITQSTQIPQNGTEICLQNNVVCPSIDGPDSIYAALPDCTKFCQCSNGVPYLHSCPSSLHFNPTLNVCDWPNDAGCIGNNNTTPAVSTDAEEITNEGTTQEDYTEAETTDLDLTETSVITDDYTEDNTIETTINEDYTEENTSTEENITITQSTQIPQNGTEICLQNNVVCPSIDGPDSIYAALPDCTKFCQCSNGVPYLHSCPSSLHFNPTLNVCDWPNDAGCIGNNNTTPAVSTDAEEITNEGTTQEDYTEAETTELDLTETSVITDDYTEDNTIETTINEDYTEENTSTEENITITQSTQIPQNGTEICLQNNVVCPSIDGPDSIYAALPDCTKFCQCSNGVPYLHSCPSSLHFNPTLNVCDWPNDAGCIGNNNTTSPISTDIDEITNEGITQEDCTEVETTELDLTETSSIIDDYTEDYTEQNTSTEGNSKQTESSPTEENITITQSTQIPQNGTEVCLQNNVVCPSIDGPDSIYAALPDCTKFCQCSNGVPYLRSCPTSLHFNPTLNVCDWPNSAGCVNSSEISPEVEKTSTETNISEYTTINEHTTDANSNKDETSTVIGVTGEISEESTDVNYEDTKNITTPTSENTSTLENICLQNNITCPPIDGPNSVYAALPDCTKFCQCSNGVPYLHECSDNLHFNPVLNVCDWPENAGCADETTNEGKIPEDETTVIGIKKKMEQ